MAALQHINPDGCYRYHRRDNRVSENQSKKLGMTVGQIPHLSRSESPVPTNTNRNADFLFGRVRPETRPGIEFPFNPGFPSEFVRPIDTTQAGPPYENQAEHRPASYVLPTHDRPESNGGFTPMHTWPVHISSYLADQLAATGASPWYRGNPFLPANQSAPVPEELNTSLWLTNLPPTCTHRQLLSAIRGCGKVFATVINPPEEDARLLALAGAGAPRPTHTTSASKLVFFDRCGADRLVAQSRAGRFTVGGYVPRLRPNRIKSAPREAGPQCRVLHIEGPSLIVNEFFLNNFFRAKFTYELEGVVTLAAARDGDVTRQEWRFGSFRCQAESARQSIARERERHTDPSSGLHLWTQVTVHYGVDPCA
ncbi:hypothetical protein GGR53DRAFT_462458 [Hypoxylon sp. FL1150]|nr:hypothetical protein GGR53DRAFT_462458 [Hypoxylon sp. FL1150]